MTEVADQTLETKLVGGSKKRRRPGWTQEDKDPMQND